MHSRLTILAAFAVFLAFAGLTPDDLHSRRGVAEQPATISAERVQPPAATRDTAITLLGEPTVKLSPSAAAVESALSALGGQISRSSHPHALRYALQGYFRYKSENPEKVRKPYFYFVDFGLDNLTPRGYVFDMENLSIVRGPFTVAHGHGSAVGGAGIPTRFLNRKGSNATSLGLYLAQETYNFRGRSGGRAYRSIGLRLQGLSGSFNSAARERGIVVHGAPYVTARRAGRSEGCPAMELDLARQLIPMIADGGLVFHFSPADERWMRDDPWAADASRFAYAE